MACGCVQVPASNTADAVTVRVDSVSYADVPFGSLAVVVTIANSSARKVYVLTTGGTALERIEQFKDSAWRPIYPVKPATLGQVASVAPGATHRDVAVLNLARGTTPILSANDMLGTYRAIYLIFANWNPAVAGVPPGELLPNQERTSELFVVRHPKS